MRRTVVLCVLGLVLTGCADPTSRSGSTTGATTGATTGTTTGTTKPATYGDLVVADGQEVWVHGQLTARSGGGWQLCYPAGAKLASDPDPTAPEDCGPRFLVKLTGAAPSVALAGKAVAARGTLAGTTLEATSVGPATIPEPLPDPPSPCPTPKDGWPSIDGTSDEPDADQVLKYVRAHGDDYGAVWLDRPGMGSAYPTYPNAEGPGGPISVLNVGTSLDLAKARAAVEKLYAGSVCVYPYTWSFRQIATARKAVEERLTVLDYDFPHEGASMRVRMVTQADADALAPYAGAVEIVPSITPVG